MQKRTRGRARRASMALECKLQDPSWSGQMHCQFIRATPMPSAGANCYRTRLRERPGGVARNTGKKSLDMADQDAIAVDPELSGGACKVACYTHGR